MEDCLTRYGGLVWSIARRLSANNADAEDAVQEIFIDLWRSSSRYDAGIASESTFIATIARRRLIDRRRRQDRRPTTATLDEQQFPQSPPDPIERLQLCDDAALARGKMLELSGDQQRVLTLAIEKGCSQTEIAERLELPLGTVKTHARRGLIKLRELMAVDAAAPSTDGGAS